MTEHKTVVCPVCNREFAPSAGQLKLLRDGQGIYCSSDCYANVPGRAKKVHCDYCGNTPYIYSSAAIVDPLGKREFCSLDCLYAYLLRERHGLRLPPVSMVPLVTVSQLTPEARLYTMRQYSEPQMRLFTELLRRTSQRWAMEHVVDVHRYVGGERQTYRIDIAETKVKLAIECDGPEHAEKAAQVKDTVRDAVLGELGWTTVRVTNETIMDDLEGAFRQVYSVLMTLPREGQPAK